MRKVTIFVAILAAAAIAWPGLASAKGPGSGGSSSGGSGSGGSGSGGSGGSGSGSGSSGKNWNGNNNWGWNSWRPYYRDYYYFAERPIYENPVFSGLPIKIVNPATNNVTLNYTLNGTVYTIPPGYSQKFVEDRSWVVEFSRGGSFGDARYGLEPGVYVFGATSHGWELYHQAEESAPVAGPTNPPPPDVTPANPPPKPMTAPQMR